MKKALLFFIFASIASVLYGQCEQENPEGLSFSIKQKPECAVPNQIEVSFKNATDQKRSICWHDFTRTWGVPLCCSVSVSDSSKVIVLEKFNWGNFFNPTNFSNMEKKSELIEILPETTFTKDIILYWNGIHSGKYTIQLFYGSGKNELFSNEIQADIR